MAGSRRKKKKKQNIPHLEAETDFYSIFKVEDDGAQPQSFAESMEDNLDQVLLDAAILQRKEAERGGRSPRLGQDKKNDYPPPQMDIDLHGLSGAAAEVKLESFFLTAKGRGLKSVRIITGKGLHSNGPGVLRDITEIKLTELKRRYLGLNWHWENQSKEDSGAVIVHIA